ncbi:hypothetical protein G3576_02560 [Roseomonas stagni]|uniref:AsmA-like C-terminal domain-containing protein n=1 Tax=Falsiroseomonas algicola TaxID=2716930 RepID=A0A6M1LFP4_9PROT|nr:hypothetical protein [Falsiroseomonas algicola]NGM18879.1 hypothetical protein [Falsiroseomonas algicola]
MRRRLVIIAVAGAIALPVAGALAQAEAERRVDRAIEFLRQSIGPDARIAWGLRQVDPVTGRTRLGDVTVTSGNRRVTVAEVLITDVSDTRLGRAEMRSLLMTEGKGERSEVARLVLGGIPIPATGAVDFTRFEIGTLEAEAVSMRGPEGNLQLGRLVAEGYAPGALGQATAEGFEFRGAGATSNHARIGRFAVAGVTMPAPGQDFDIKDVTVRSASLEGATLTDPEKKVDLALGRLAMRDWAPGRLLDLAVEGVSLGAEFGAMGPGVFRLGRFVVQGIDAAGLATAWSTNVQPPDPAPGVPQLILAEGITAEANGAPLLSLGRIQTDGSMAADGVISGTLAVDGLRITLPRGTSAPLEQLGYTEIAGGMEMLGSFARQGGMLAIGPWRTTWNEAATLTLSGRFLEMPAPAPGTPIDPDAQTAALLAARLQQLTLSWRDQGLLGRAIAMQARQQRVPEARIREQWAQMVMGMPIPGAGPSAPPRGRAAPPAPATKGAATPAPATGKGAAPAPAAPAAGQPDPFMPLREALAQFIRQPREIEISLRPLTPIAFGELTGLAGQSAEAARLLGLTVRLP